MFQLSALNEKKTEDVAEGEKAVGDTKEAQEAQAFKLYNEALCLQQNNQHEEAVNVYEQLLKTPLVIESATTLVNEHNEAIEHPLKDPGLILKYSTHKNVANICSSKGDRNKAMENYLQAVMLDTSDVTLWYKIGVLAAQMSNLHLSRRALTQGLQCNPNHWPCLDCVITVCYAILDYSNCLIWISKALKKDPRYRKGIYFRRKMISECPHLEKDTEHLFQNCGTEVFNIEIPETESKTFLDEALTLRENNRKLCKRPEIPILPLQIPMKSLTWLELGKSLIATYKFIETQDEPISITNKIDLNVFENGDTSQVKMCETSVTEDKLNDSESKANSSVISTSSDTTSEAKVNPVTTTAETQSSSTSDIVEAVESKSITTSSVIESCTTGTEIQTNDLSLLNSSIATLSDVNNSGQKKNVKRKREKVSDYERQNKRRSSRMKKTTYAVSYSVPDHNLSPDFCSCLLNFIPKSLLPPSETTMPLDLDSDTNSQDSTLLNDSVDHSMDSSILTPTAEKGNVHSENQALNIDFAVSANESQNLDDNLQDEKNFHAGESVPENKTENNLPVSTVAMETSVQETPEKMEVTETNPEMSAFEVSTHVAKSSGQSSAKVTTDTLKMSDSSKNENEKSLHGNDTVEQFPSTNGKSQPLNDEAIEVKKFLEKYKENCGIFVLLQKYCKWMGHRSHLKWEKGLQEVFLTAYGIVRPNTKIETITSSNMATNEKIMLAYCILTNMECVLDIKYQKSSIEFDYVLNSLEFNDMIYIRTASFHPEILEEGENTDYRFKNFVLRYQWVRAQYCYLMGDKDDAYRALIVASKLCVGAEIPLHHLSHHNLIDQSSIDRRLDSLKRYQVFEKIEGLFTQKKFPEVVKQLTPQFEDPNSGKDLVEAPEDDSTALEKPMLLKYFVESAIAINEPGLVIKSVVITFCKSAKMINSFEKSKSLKKNSKILDKYQNLLQFCLKHLYTMLNSSNEKLGTLEQNYLTQLTGNLLSVIQRSMVQLCTKYGFTSQFGTLNKVAKTSVPHDSLLYPWILLFIISKFEEEKVKDSLTPEQPNELSGSIKLLMTTHEWLGEKGICCVDGGVFLRLFLNNLLLFFEHEIEITKNAETTKVVDVTELSSDSKRSLTPVDNKKVLKSEIEQCFFCLFGYPNKILKSSSLTDHSSQQSALTWKDGKILFKYFRPSVLPGFDSYKANTMLSEMASLLMRITKLVPENILSKLKDCVDVVEGFIESNDAEKKLKISSVCDENDLIVIKDIYYLLADYYFKNKEMSQAAKHYLFDLSINPDRFDSWAGLALAKSSIVDDRLRRCITKSSTKEPSVLRISKYALNCFKKAMTIERASTTLWIEYGSLAYWIHSYHSRQKKMKVKISDEEKKALESQKDEMLLLAKQCFEFALECDAEDINNEEWLIQYMLGKISEKKRDPPLPYLQKYSRAAGLLHRKHAKYPKKIQFKSYQSDYAIEALELHFRLHASILKLVQHEVNILDGFEKCEKNLLTLKDYETFDDLIEEASRSNFVRREVLPYSQFDSEGHFQKYSSPAKLIVTPPQSQTSLMLGSLVPDSIVNALSLQIVESMQSEAANADDSSMDAEATTQEEEIQTDSVSHTENMTQNTENSAPTASAIVSFEEPKITFTDEMRQQHAIRLIKRCTSGLHLCLSRLPQHYKSIYRLAHLYMNCGKSRRHLTWSCDLLLGTESPWQQLSHMPAQGLLTERNKTNLFNGVWKIPVDEIDRPGSFGSHLYKCILMLLEILLEQKDHNKLLYLHNMLHRNPDQGKKYLRDTDRIHASKKALSYSIKTLQKKVDLFILSPLKNNNEIFLQNQSEKEIAESYFKKSSEMMSHLMDASKLYQQKQRVGNLDDTFMSIYEVTEPHKELLLTTYQKYTLSCPQAISLFSNNELISTGAKIDKILKYCQQLSAKSKIAAATTQKAEDKFVSESKKVVNAEEKVAMKNLVHDTSINKSESDVSKVQADIGKPPFDDKDLKDNFQSSTTKISFTPVIGNNLVNTPSDSFTPIRDTTMPKTGVDAVSQGALTDNNNTSKSTESMCVSESGNAKAQNNYIDSERLSPVEEIGIENIAEPNEKAVKLIDASEIGGSGVSMVKTETRVYTKVVPSRPFARLSHSPRSAFTPTKFPNEIGNMGLKRSPQFDRLMPHSKGGKAPLLRSASMPVSMEDEPVRNPHRTLQRSGSISDYTKEKLKRSILQKTSAALVRKPSITEFEIEQIFTDPDSSQSEDEDDTEIMFKPLEAVEHDELPSTSSQISHSNVINVPVAVTPVLQHMSPNVSPSPPSTTVT